MRPTPPPAPILAFALAAACAAPITAQNLFRSDLDGSQNMPPNSSAATAWGTAALNPDLSVTYRLESVGLVAISAHIHLGGPGASGPILATLLPGPTSWSGTTAPLSAADAAALRAGGTYFNVHTNALPFGEIRGQILPSPARFAAAADGLQQTPPNGSAATATGSFTIHADRTISYEIHATGIVSTATEIHIGEPGSVGPRIFNFGTGVGPWIGTTAPITEAEQELFQAGATYLNVHSSAHLLGEIRGQVYAVGEPYGAACGGAAGYDCRLDSEMVPYSGAPIRLRLSGGEPGGRGLLAAALEPAATLDAGCAVHVALPALRTLPLVLDAAGAAELLAALPIYVADRTLYLQFAGLSGGALSYASNALAVTVEVF